MINKDMRNLSKKNRKIVNSILTCLPWTSINFIALKDMQREIVAMALDGERDGKEMTAVFGGDYEQFCKDISASAPKKSLTERVALIIFYISGMLTLLLPMLWLRFYLPAHHNVFGSHILILNFDLITFVINGFGSILVVTSLYRRSFKKNALDIKQYIAYAVVYICVAVIALLGVRILIGRKMLFLDVIPGTAAMGMITIISWLTFYFTAKRNLK